MKRSEVVEIARTYIGTPFRHQGRSKVYGVDCVGLLVCVLWECNIKVDDIASYNGLVDAGLLRSKLDLTLDEIPLTIGMNGNVQVGYYDYKPGDILLLRIGKNPQHIGIVTDIGIIHTHEGSGYVVETSLGKWKERIVTAYHIYGVEE